jgi:eukaryotic-like serine/threonine-protein kinase
MPLTPGTRLGSYVIEAPLGAGGMGEVYKARDTRLNRDVAIKVLPEQLALDPDRVARLKRARAVNFGAAVVIAAVPQGGHRRRSRSACRG